MKEEENEEKKEERKDERKEEKNKRRRVRMKEGSREQWGLARREGFMLYSPLASLSFSSLISQIPPFFSFVPFFPVFYLNSTFFLPFPCLFFLLSRLFFFLLPSPLVVPLFESLSGRLQLILCEFHYAVEF